MEDLDDLILQLENEISHARRPMLSAGVIVDSEKMLGIIQRIKELLPDSVAEAKYIIATSEKRRQDDIQHAQNMVINAKQRAQEIVNEHHIVAQARYEADGIVKNAKEYANRIVSGANREIYELLTETELHIQKSLTLISNAKKGGASPPQGE
ncbi:MAG: hypothetical protein FWD49_04445 [Firmicutes bacterium]|nr:hypothetical protein [Bacillota bacterium]